MTFRAALYLAFIWANVPVGYKALRGGLSYAWWLLLLAIMVSLSLISLVSTDPGRVPSDTVQQLCAAEGGAVATQQQQSFNQFCSLCNAHKPVRAHHCRICNRCVQKMDHHCHWVGRCVGRGNYKAYLLVLFYGCICSGTMLAVLWRMWPYVTDVSWLTAVTLVIDGLLLLVAFLCVSYLFVWHAYLVTANVTTIEYFKWKRSMRDPGHYNPTAGSSVRQSEYNRGLWFNLREALGYDVWLWLWPGLGQWNGYSWNSGNGGGGRGSAIAGWFLREARRPADSTARGVREVKSGLFVSRTRSRSGSHVIGDVGHGVEMPTLRSPPSPSNSM